MDEERSKLIAEIAAALRDATRGDESHAAGLIYELATGRMEPASVRAEFAELSLRRT